jgi:hypothetical protein
MHLNYGVPYYNKSTDQCRNIGRRGGRARARNLRLRLMQKRESPRLAPPKHLPETAHEANALLDERFPHLRDVFDPRQSKQAEVTAPKPVLA